MPAPNNGANLGFERELWQAGDALRSNMDAAEYKRDIRDRSEIVCSCIDRPAAPRGLS